MTETRKGRKKQVTLLLCLLVTHIFIVPTAEVPTNEEETWMKWARIAWSYYEPGKGVVKSTGLHDAGKGFHQFTDWDLATYIIAIIDAETLGILPREGIWGSDYRLRKILDFLKNRPLTNGIPYLWYSSLTGKNVNSQRTNPSDAGRLLIALYLLKERRPDLANEIDYIVDRNNFHLLASDAKAWKTTGGFYAYYVAQGFKLFGFEECKPVKKALEWINDLQKCPKVNVNGIELPKTWITSEPILLGAIELEDANLIHYANLTLLAQEARYKKTGVYVAFSEGNTGLDNPTYVYEWIVSGSETWRITDPSGKEESIPPIIFLKAAIAYHALFSTNYTKKLVNFLMSRLEDKNFGFSHGFPEGIDAEGRLVNLIIDKTNGLILSAARYVLTKKMKPKLEFSDLTSDEEASLGRQTSISGYVLNAGSIAASNVTVTISLGNFQVAHTNLGLIGPKESKFFVLKFEVPSQLELGENKIKLEANCKEGSYASQEVSINIKMAPELEFEALYFPSTAIKGMTIRANGSVINSGEGDAQNVRLLLYLDDVLLSEKELGNITSGSSSQVSIEAVIPPEIDEGDHTLRLVLKCGNDEWVYEHFIAIGETQVELITKALEKVSEMIEEIRGLLERAEEVAEIKGSEDIFRKIESNYLEAVQNFEDGNYNESARLLDDTIVELESLLLLVKNELYKILDSESAELAGKSTSSNLSSIIMGIRRLIEELKDQEPVKAINGFVEVAHLLDDVQGLIEEIGQEHKEKEELVKELNLTQEKILMLNRRAMIGAVMVAVLTFFIGLIIGRAWIFRGKERGT